jgi:bifunctional oligoribonuclease and PAP phosphatase NrnA
MKDKIIEAIKQFDTIIIHRHVRPDPDAYGSQGGLAEMIRASFPTKKVLLAGEDEESLRFLNEMDTIADTQYEDALVIVCDTANQERICDQRYASGKLLIKIDHHPNDDQYGDVIWVDTDASSSSEMIYELYLHAKEQGFQLNANAAKLIYAGIVGDTGRFLFPSTKSKTFKYAGDLVQYNFSFTEIYEKLYSTKQNVAHLSGYILQNFSLSPTGVASMVLKNELLKKYKVEPTEASQLVSILGNIEGIKAWVFFVEEEDQIRVRLRSKGPVINQVAKRYKGGGHPLAAGASIYSWAEVEHVVRDLEEVCNNY